MRAVVAVVAAYAIGCIATGYYVVRALTGEDVRRHATGSSGARNVGRRAGTTAAAATLAADVVKGAAAVALADAVAGEGAAAVALVAVVLGHVAPAQLGFRGGRGLGPALGGMLVLDPRVAAIALAVAAMCVVATRAFTIAGLAGVATASVAAAALGETRTAVAAAGAAVVILAAHARSGPRRGG
jgi:glycerol-3-phosphate acyltransferase PlsY